MRTGLREVLKQFHELPKTGQDSLLRDLYRLSGANALMMENRLCGEADFTAQIARMERETIGKVYRKGVPGIIDGRKVNAIIREAEKARADFRVLMELEELAYRGFTEFLHEYGGGPDSYDDMGPAHLEAYLSLARDNLPDTKRDEIYAQVKTYIRSKDNMNQDYNFDAYEVVTGESCY